MPLPEDTLLENRYRIDGLLAYGGMGAVYRAFDTNLQVDVAIKENYFSTPEAIEQFKREALILAKLRHPSLPHVLQHFSHEGQQYLVMEFIEGQNLWEQIKRRSEPFSETQALEWLHKICQAVSYLHNQSPPIIHRDIKPQNIKAMPDGQVVLVDFGVAKEGTAEARTATGARGVTPGFSPPEQYSGGGSSPASDIYALGATLYALLTGIKPPDSVSLAIGEIEYIPPDQINPSISPAVAEAITWAMQPRPVDRPQAVQAWLERLLSIREERSRMETPPPTVDLVLENPPDASPQDEVNIPSTPAPEDPPLEEKSETSAGLTCPECGENNRPDISFCESCGSPLKGSVPSLVLSSEQDAARTADCPKCGTENRAGIRFCEDCGTPLPRTTPPATLENKQPSPPPTCPHCGSIHRPDVQFCEECGTKLGN